MSFIATLGILAVATSLGAVDSPEIRIDESGVKAGVEVSASGKRPGDGRLGAGGDWLWLGPFGGDVADVSASPVDGTIVLAGLAPSSGDGGLYRSTDGGANWSKAADLGTNHVYDIEYTPSGIVYIATIESVWKSVDGGASFSQLNLGIGLNDQVYEVAIDPNDADAIWAGVADAMGSQPINVMRSPDGGETWVNKTPSMPTMSCQGIAVNPSDSDKVYACFGGGFGGGQVWVSSDGGSTWSDRTTGLPGNPMNDLVHNGSRLLAAGGLLYGSQYVGLYVSTDDGETWSKLHDSTWPLRVINDIDLDPNDPDVILAASGGAGIYYTADGGDSWYCGIGGTETSSLNSVRFVPGESQTIFLGAASTGVMKSSDAGGEFAASSTGIGAMNVTTLHSNPLAPNEVSITFEGQNNGGVLSSIDGGQSWFLESVPATRWSNVRYAPDGTLYAISDGPTTVAPEGVYRKNGDDTWTCLGPDQGTYFESELMALTFSENDPNLIMTGGSDFGYAGNEMTIWRSTDAGGSWTKVFEKFPEDSRDVMDIKIIEDGTDMEMVACFTDYGGDQEGGAMRSTDGGLNWSMSSSGLPIGVQGGNMCVSPTDTETFFLADRDYGYGGVHRTVDGGQSWSQTVFTGTVVVDVMCDPFDNQVLYLAHNGSDAVMKSEDGGTSFLPFDDGLESAGWARDLALTTGGSPELLLATTTGVYSASLAAPCPADVNGDQVIDVLDLLAILSAWGETGELDEDINGDGVVDVLDLLEVLSAWGPCA